MALNSFMVPLGTELPDLAAPAVDGSDVELRSLAGAPALVVVFLCNHCPYVRHIEQRLAQVHREFEASGVTFVGIRSNDLDSHPEDGPAGMAEQVARTGWRFPYLSDDDQSMALAFHAACTPDFFVYDQNARLAYRGAMDTSTPKNGEPTDAHLLRDALNRIISGRAVPEPHRPAMGCGIKWAPGNEPPAVSFPGSA